MKLVIEFVGVDGLDRNVTTESFLIPELADVQKFMFSDKYYLTASGLARVCPSMMSLVLWITSFNCCRTSLLFLMLNVLLKKKAVYLNANSPISGAFWCSACSVGVPSTCTFSTMNFLGVERSFTDEVGPSRRNCCLTGCVGDFSQLLKCFSKLLAQLMVLPLWVTTFLLSDGRFTVVLLEHNFIGEESGTPIAFKFGSFYRTFHWLLNIFHLLVSHRKHDFEFIIV